VPHTRKIYFENAADMPLFCGEDLNFGAFSKNFPPGLPTTVTRGQHPKKCG
jgi:hypothetical protein